MNRLETDVNEVIEKHARDDRERVIRRGIARRIGAAGLALAAVVTLGAYKATGVGTDRSAGARRVLPTGDIDGAYKGDANFGSNFTCEVTAKNKEVIKGEITYHDTGTSTVAGVDFPSSASRRC